MQLIVRVTNRCNFKCSFCSASNLSQTTDLPFDKLIEFIEQYKDKASSVVFEGGDPLCMKPQYYHRFLQWKDNHHDTRIRKLLVSFTSNLWDFYKRPEKWLDIFKREDVDIGTSFQYGTGRKITQNLPYSEELFIRVFNKVVELTDKKPGFIAVIDYDNQDTIINTVNLAKRLDTVCKINPLFTSGRSTTFYRWDDMLLQYAKLFELGLDQYEMNCQMIRGIITGDVQRAGCPLHNRYCENDFRVISPDGYIKTCSMEQNSISELSQSIITLYKNHQVNDITTNRKLKLASTKCLTCDYYRWCNYCRIKIQEFKTIQDKDQYCKNIENAIQRIKKVVLQ